MVSWVNASKGHIPSNAIPVGHDPSGKLYVARASIPGGGVQLGKIGASFGAAYIPFGGSEVPCPNYQVLVGTSDEAKSGGPTYPTAFAPYGAKGPAPVPAWPALFPEVYPPDQHARNGFVPPVFGNVEATGQISAALQQYLSGAQGTSAAPILEFSAIVCGQENDGTPLFCALVEYKNGVHPGKVRLGLGGANIGWGGAEIAGLSPYSVLCDASYGFLPTSNNGSTIPDGCFSCGYDNDNAPLYFARRLANWGAQIGKVSPHYNAAQIGYADVVENIWLPGTYQVMIAASSGSNVGHSANANDGYVPDGAIVLGCEADGTPLFGALAGAFVGGSGPWPNNATVVQLGKVRRDFGGARIPYNGQEVLTTSYSVLLAGGFPTMGGLGFPA
jgi:hypothetical protein